MPQLTIYCLLQIYKEILFYHRKYFNVLCQKWINGFIVFFLGNSYTAVDDLPSLVVGLALSGGHEIFVDKNTPGGYTLGFPSNGHL